MGCEEELDISSSSVDLRNLSYTVSSPLSELLIGEIRIHRLYVVSQANLWRNKKLQAECGSKQESSIQQKLYLSYRFVHLWQGLLYVLEVSEVLPSGGENLNYVRVSIYHGATAQGSFDIESAT